MGYHGKSRIIWKISMWLVAISLIIGDILGMVALKYLNDKIKSQFNLNTVCPSKFTKA